MAERQYGVSLDDIRKDHVERYKFAIDRVGGIVLDAACGCGYGSYMIYDGGYAIRPTVIGVDIEQEALEFASAHWSGPTYIKADLTDLRVFGVDWVVSFETIEHLEDPRPFLRNLDPQYGMICSVPNEEKAPFRAEAFVHDKYPHRRHYTPSEFEHLLNSCGWVVQGHHSQKNKYSPVTPGTDGMYLVYECIRVAGS